MFSIFAVGHTNKTIMKQCNKEYCHEDGNLRCSRCKKVNYCSNKCQWSDWKKHKKQCKKPEDKGEIGKDDGGVRSQTITKTVDSNHKGRFASNKKGTSSPTTTTLTLADFFKMHQNNPEVQAIT